MEFSTSALPTVVLILEKHGDWRLSYLFVYLDLLSSDPFSSLIFFLLFFSSLTLPTYVFSSVLIIVGSLTSKLPSVNAPGAA